VNRWNCYLVDFLLADCCSLDCLPKLCFLTPSTRVDTALFCCCVVRKRFSKSHWDAVIQKYKEFTLDRDDQDLYLPFVQPVFDPIYRLLEENHLSHRRSSKNPIRWLPPHVIDLHPYGGISAHVDSTRFSGDIVAGLSLISPCIMRLRPATEDGIPDPNQLDKYVDLLLEPLSLYVLHGDGRYKYTHEIMPSNTIFNINGENPRLISREHRCSVIFRDEK
jgi:alkylated DNA repair protein alkB homolog 7